jgi:hypothetical protein
VAVFAPVIASSSEIFLSLIINLCLDDVIQNDSRLDVVVWLIPARAF